MNAKEYFQLPFRHHILSKHLEREPKLVIDVGCGNSALKTKRLLPSATYVGIDIRPRSSLSAELRQTIDEYHEIDLTRDLVPDYLRKRADIVILAHVLEHIENGLDVLTQACDLLASGGLIYVEYPRLKSTQFPSMSGTLNFWDDPTHVHLYQMVEILNVFNGERLRVLEFGTRRYWRRVLASPLVLAYLLWVKDSSPAVALWDVLGFAEYAIARRDEAGRTTSTSTL